MDQEGDVKPVELPPIVCLDCPAIMRMDYAECELRDNSVLVLLWCHNTHMVARVDEDVLLRVHHQPSAKLTSEHIRIVEPKHIEEMIRSSEEVMLKAGRRLEMLERFRLADPTAVES